MSSSGSDIYTQNKELFDVAHEAQGSAILLLERFNSKDVRLTDIPSHKRISLFFLARAIKTFSSILLLCREGYSQDVATLLRSLLENLIATKYITRDPVTADEKAVRFVNYKWVILKRYMDQEDPSTKGLIEEKFKEFKQKYNIASDRGLLSWSGKSVRDMARFADRELLAEYDMTFRLCSRFSHPSIIGDKEYMDYEGKTLTFLPFSSPLGISQNIKSSVRYMLDFLNIFNGLFKLGQDAGLKNLKTKSDNVFRMAKYNKSPSLKKTFSESDKKDRAILIKFGLAKNL